MKVPLSDNENAGGASPGFEVWEFDVFPEEFATFPFPDDVRKAIFSQHHEELVAVEGGPISRSRSSLSSRLMCIPTQCAIGYVKWS